MIQDTSKIIDALEGALPFLLFMHIQTFHPISNILQGIKYLWQWH